MPSYTCQNETKYTIKKINLLFLKSIKKFPMNLGLQLRKLRTAKKYSQQFVADELKISRNAYMAWESGKTQLSVEKMERICHFYEIGLKDLLNPMTNNFENVWLSN